MPPICIKCKQALRLYPPNVVARQIICGHRLCPGCYEDRMKLPEEKVYCPGADSEDEDMRKVCSNSNMKDANPDWGLQRDLKFTLVYCKNKVHGCKIEMEWRQLDEHMQKCSFKQVNVEVPMNDPLSVCENKKDGKDGRKKDLVSNPQGIFPSVADHTTSLQSKSHTIVGSGEQNSNKRCKEMSDTVN